jgi:hypothetical protein
MPSALLVEQCTQGAEVFLESFQERVAVLLLWCEKFRKRELYFVVADQPGAQFGLTRMSSGDERLFECFASEQASTDDVTEGRVTGAPRAKQAKSDECAGDRPIARRKRIGEGEDGVE